MKKQTGRWLLLLLLFLCVPMTAWAAAEAPAVTEDEYRFYLETYSGYYLDDMDVSSYSDAELRNKLKAAIQAVDDSSDAYAEALQAALWQYEEADDLDPYNYTEAELERFVARLLADHTCAYYSSILTEGYQVTEDLSAYTPQQLKALYHQTVLAQEFGVTEDLSEQPWYLLEDMHNRYEQIAYLQQTYGVTEDLSEESLEALFDRTARLEEIAYLQQEYGVQEDLSDYSLDALFELESRLLLEDELRHGHGIDYDFSVYTIEELEAMLDEIAAEDYAQQMEDEWAVAQEQVNVQLNGMDFYFTGEPDSHWQYGSYDSPYTSDVRPVIREDRVYIPFRAVFQALGAEVSYDATSRTVTAQRGDHRLSFTAGQPQYVMDDVAIAMDGQTFVQDGRVFVPVRFASQALGAAVGWDADTHTVVIVERDKLLRGYQGKFTILDDYRAHWDFTDGANRALQGTVRLQAHITDSSAQGTTQELPLGLTVELSELASNTGSNLNAAIALDPESVTAMLDRWAGLDDGMEQLLGLLQTVHISYILDLEQGCIYVKSELLDLLQGEPDSWYRIKLEDYLEPEEYSYYLTLLQQAVHCDGSSTIDEQIAALIQTMPLNDRFAVSSTLEVLEMLYRFASDDGLGATAEGYMHRVGSAEEGYQAQLLFLSTNGQIDGARISVNQDSLDRKLNFQLEESDHVITMTLTSAWEDWLTEMTVDASGTMVYTASEEEPLAIPESGSTVYDLEELFATW